MEQNAVIFKESVVLGYDVRHLMLRSSSENSATNHHWCRAKTRNWLLNHTAKKSSKSKDKHD